MSIRATMAVAAAVIAPITANIQQSGNVTPVEARAQHPAGDHIDDAVVSTDPAYRWDHDPMAYCETTSTAARLGETITRHDAFYADYERIEPNPTDQGGRLYGGGGWIFHTRTANNVTAHIQILPDEFDEVSGNISFTHDGSHISGACRQYTGQPLPEAKVERRPVRKKQQAMSPPPPIPPAEFTPSGLSFTHLRTWTETEEGRSITRSLYEISDSQGQTGSYGLTITAQNSWSKCTFDEDGNSNCVNSAGGSYTLKPASVDWLLRLVHDSEVQR